MGVAGGLGLMDYSYQHNPVPALVVFGVIVLTLLYVTPKIFRFTRIRVWLLWKKTSSPPADREIGGAAERNCPPIATCFSPA